MRYLNFRPVGRKRAKLSQWELAQELHVSQTDISDFESGKKLPNIEMREKICELLSKKLEEVFPL